MKHNLQVDERFCACGAAMQLEYTGDDHASVNGAIAKMFDEIHHTPNCGPVTPQAAAIARSELARYELQARVTAGTPGSGTPRRSGVGDDSGPPVADPAPTERTEPTLNDTMTFLSEYEMIFPDYDGTRGRIILTAVTLLGLPPFGHYRSRDAWVETSDDGPAHIRLLCKLGSGNRDSHKESVEILRSNPWYLTDFDEPFNPTYASFLFKLPETLSPEARAELASGAVAKRDLSVEAEAATRKFAWSGSAQQ